MSLRVIYALSVFLIAYSSFWSAYILVGKGRIWSARAAVIPAVVQIPAFLMEETIFAYVAILASVIVGFAVAFCHSKTNWFISAAAVFIAVTFELSGQMIWKIFCFNALQAMVEAAIGILFPLLLCLFKIVIFPENYILTKDQKKVIRGRLYLFSGLVILFIWQILILALLEDQVIFLGLTLLIQLLVLLQLREQVRSMQDKVESVIDKQYQAELLSFMRVIRSQRHDFNFHIQTIYGMIENENFDECKAYVSSMMKTVVSTNEILPLYHPAISALLNTFREMAFQKGLQMEIEIHDNLQFISTTVFETNTILGNLLQNAIDELELHPENESRNIKLLIIKRGRYNIIKVSNQCHLSPEEMSRIFMPGFTTKMEHEGLGLANALHVAEKYDGTVYPEFEGNVVHFIARIPMKQA